MKPKLYGVMAEFNSSEDLLTAARETYELGYRKIDAFSPFPIEGLSEAIGFHSTRLPLLVLAGGVLGCVGGYFLQYYIAVMSYPVNIGGRPLNSWPAFIPVTFECTILMAALAAVLGMFALNGLPQPHHPVFNVPQFQLASRDKFFLCIEASDPQFQLEIVRSFMNTLNPREVAVVED